MKLVTIVSANRTIEGLASKENIGAHLAYWLTKFYVKTQPDVEFFDKEMGKLFKKYECSEKDGNFIIPPENQEAFKAEAEAIQNTEADDPGIRFSLAELSNELKLTITQMYALMDFIDEDQK